MTGPSWLTDILAAGMIAVSLYCAGRLVASRRPWPEMTQDADGAHVLMGVVMAGMLAPRLSFGWNGMWALVFGAAAVWFAWRTGRAWQLGRARRQDATCGGQFPHSVPHLIQCVAMAYMLVAVPGVRAPAGSAAIVTRSASAFGPFPALTFVLTLCLLGQVVYTIDRLTAARRPAAPALARLVLAPRFAAACEIAMGITMSYLLIVMR